MHNNSKIQEPSMAVRNIINVCVLLVLIIHLVLVDLFSFLGSILAMSGKDCVAVAVDKRFGSGPQAVSYTHLTLPTKA